MKPERDTTRIVRSWLEHGVTDLPDRVLDPVLDKLPATPQRRHAWQARRSTRMSNFFKIALAAAAVVVVGAVGLTLLPRSSVPSVGAAPTSSPTPTATVAPGASAIPALPPEGASIEPGRYRLYNPAMVGNLSIEVPAGWTVESTDMIAKNRGFENSDAGVLFAFWPITGTFVDPCTDHTLVQPSPGPGIDELADALANQPGTEAEPPEAVTVDGFAAKRVDVTVTADIDACPPAGSGFWLWAAPDGDRRYVQGTDELNVIHIVDVDGDRLTFNGRFPAGTTAADRSGARGDHRFHRHRALSHGPPNTWWAGPMPAHQEAQPRPVDPATAPAGATGSA